MTIHRCEIPIPPSANHMHRMVWPRGGRPFNVSTPAYKAWQKHAALLLRVALPVVRVLPIRVRVEIHGGKGFSLARDLDNVLKPIMDALQFAGIITDDRVTEIAGIVAEYIVPKSKKDLASCWVEIGEAE